MIGVLANLPSFNFVAALTYIRLAFVEHCLHSLVAIPELQTSINDFLPNALMHPAADREIRRSKDELHK
jgi:hypothetical protein